VRGPEAALARPPHLRGHDELDVLEDPYVLLDPVQGQAEGLGELADGRRRARQALEDAASGWIREGEVRAVECVEL
jgi:hypothetical protein